MLWNPGGKRKDVFSAFSSRYLGGTFMYTFAKKKNNNNNHHFAHYWGGAHYAFAAAKKYIYNHCQTNNNKYVVGH